jgi:hypothetical protein
MGDYLRLLTADDQEIPLATLQRAVPFGAVSSVDHPGMLGNYLTVGAEIDQAETIWATVERNPVAPDTIGAEEVAEFIDSLESGGPPSAIRWLTDFLETTRVIYAIRIHPEAMARDSQSVDAVNAVRSALHDAVGGIGQWDGHGFTNEDDRLIWCDPRTTLSGTTRAAILDESTGKWIPFDLNLDDPADVAAFLRGDIPGRRHQRSGSSSHSS